MDEGFADFHGYGVTCVSPGPGCRPGFLSASIPDKDAVAARDLSVDTHCLTTLLRAAYENDSSDMFISAGTQYSIGTLIATAMYEAGNQNGQLEVMQKALIASYDDPAGGTADDPGGFKQQFTLLAATPSAFTPELLTDTIAAHLPKNSSIQKAFCNQMADRLQLMCYTPTALDPACEDLQAGVPNGQLAHCPTSTTRGTTVCKALPPRSP